MSRKSISRQLRALCTVPLLGLVWTGLLITSVVACGEGTEELPPPLVQLTTEGENYEPMWSPDGKYIAFESKRSGNLDIFVMKADGSEQIQLTDDEANDASPSWSPEGDAIYFFSDRQGPKNVQGRWRMYRMKPDGSEQELVRASQNDSFRPVVSPDGERIAFDAYSKDAGTHQIYTIRPNGSGIQSLTQTESYDAAPQWSPDGEKLAFLSERDFEPDIDPKATPAEIYVMAADGSEPTRLTTLEARSHYPYWSPDGKFIGFESDAAGNLDLFAVTADGKRLLRLTDDPARDTSLSWSPDGTHIAFVSDRDGKPDVYTLRLPEDWRERTYP